MPRPVVPGVNDLQSQFPDLAKEWHPTRNGDLKPAEVTRSSRRIVWWQCSNYPDHEWDTKIADRSNGIGCPICDGKSVLEGFNDLQSQFPDLAKEWHPTRNGDLKPTGVTRGSGRKVWWQCSSYPDHEWETKIVDRSNGTNCPICAGQRVLEGFNDLVTTEPDLAKEWHPTRNGDLKPTGVTRGSGRKVWWQCSKYPDHEWGKTVVDRSKGYACPICSGKVVLEGFNDLKTTELDLAKEWHPIKNGDLKPTEFTRGSRQKVWWKCREHPDHEWRTAISSRTCGTASGCPICAGNRVLEGFNDLKTTEPDLAKEWHPTRNDDLKPTEVTRSSNQKVWWQCKRYPNHEWYAKIYSRSSGLDCPICAGAKVLEGFNDLITTEPDLAKEWHPTRNGDLKPTEVTRGSMRKVWWQCSKHLDHEWETYIGHRSHGIGCPICAGQRVLEGFNDLITTEPDLAKEWHPTRNGDLKPTEVTKGSSQKIWWQCREHPDHEWRTAISSRTRGTASGCPICAEYGFKPEKDAWFYLMQRPGEQQLGITNELDVRMKTHERNGWILLEHTEPASGQKVLDTENAFKKWLKKEVGLVKGTTENWSTTKMEVQSLAELKARSGIETDLF